MAGIVLSFFDFTGEAVRPWAEAGYICFCFDEQHSDEERREQVGKGAIVYVKADLSPYSPDWIRILTRFRDEPVVFVYSFSPCTDLASSGALHWKKKEAKDPLFQAKAVAMAKGGPLLAELLGVPYAGENPNGALSRLWRKPDHSFHPCDYGGYLPEDDVHPRWPEYIPPRDAYEKRTNLWTGNGFVMPSPRRVDPLRVEITRRNGKKTSGSPQWAKLGGKSLKTKNIRSATPRGFALAAFLSNAKGDPS